MSACAFCEISAGRAHDHLLIAEKQVIAFLPLALNARAHVLVAPRAHVETLWASDDAVLAELTRAVREVSVRLRERLGATGVNVLHASGVAAQQSVPHLHFHVLARFEGDGLDAWPALREHEVDRAALLQVLR